MFHSKKISSSSSSSRNRNGGRNCCNNQNDGDGDDDDREAGVRMVMVQVVKDLDDKAEKNTAVSASVVSLQAKNTPFSKLPFFSSPSNVAGRLSQSIRFEHLY